MATQQATLQRTTKRRLRSINFTRRARGKRRGLRGRSITTVRRPTLRRRGNSRSHSVLTRISRNKLVSVGSVLATVVVGAAGSIAYYLWKK